MTMTRTGPTPSARRIALAAVAAAGLLVALTGCRFTGADERHATPAADASGVAAVPVGSSDQTISVGGRQRTFRVYRPASLPPSTPVPLVVMLHGGFGNAARAESSYGWDAEADRQHFVVAYPDGLDRAWAVGGGCCGTPGRTGADDVAFVVAVVKTVSGRLPVDAARVYATGISNGGMMAYRLACDSGIFAAVGPDSATLLGGCPSPAPVSVIHLHGTADHNIPYGGGQGDGVAHIDGPAVPDVVATWRAVDGCPGPSVTTAGPVTTSIAACPDGRAVELVTIAGAGHQWPGSAGKSVIQRVLGADPPSTALDATDVIWHFFAAHPRTAHPRTA